MDQMVAQTDIKLADLQKNNENRRYLSRSYPLFISKASPYEYTVNRALNRAFIITTIEPEGSLHRVNAVFVQVRTN